MRPAAQVLTGALAAPETLGSGRLICIDGPAGSGKTTLADEISLSAGCPVLRMDDLYPGWDGLVDGVDPHVLGILEPLARGALGRYRRYDWESGEYAEEHTVAPAPLLVLEGVASGNLAWASLITMLVWIEAPTEVRHRRGLERDGEAFAPHWRRWAEQEAELFARERTRERADLRFRS